MEINERMADETLVRIETIQQHIQAVENAQSIVQGASYGHAPNYAKDLLDALYKKELDEWRNLFLWAITLPRKRRERIKAMAYERFLSERFSVCHWLNNGVTPSSWSAMEEEAFRAKVREIYLRESKDDIDAGSGEA